MNAEQGILIVEDNEDDIILVKRALKKAGVSARLSIVTDGEQAIDYLAGTGIFEHPEKPPLPVMVLLDLKLPKRSGFEVLEWIRSHATLATLPVVVFTTSTLPRDLEKAYALGANSYLKKPVSLDDTTALLRTVGLYWLVHNERPPEVKRI
jgi:CheY-like chemotaxis protein